MQRDHILKAELKQAIAECEPLRAENAQLKARLGDYPKTPTRPAVAFGNEPGTKKETPETLTSTLRLTKR